MPSKDVYTFVLVHGAWHGGWCWGLVAQILRARGHNVSAPTLTGLGERAHLLTEHVDFETFVLDVQNHIETERLRDVVLVGHSFGGNVITVVADKSVDRIKRLIFLDAALPEDGRNIMDQLSHTVAEGRISLSRKSSGGLTMPCPSPEAFGIFLPEHEAYVQGRLTPHPINTYLSPISIRGSIGSGLPCDFISCTEPGYGFIEPALLKAQVAGWTLHEIPTGNDAMITAPHTTADLFERIAAAM